MKSLQSSSPFITISFHLLLLSLHFNHTQGSDAAVQLPRSGGSVSARSIHKRVFSVAQYGAKGDGFHNDTKALEEVWNTACSMLGRITILFPPEKEFLIYPIDMGGPCRSKITLKISGTIVAPEDPEVWDGLNPRKWLYFHSLKYLTLEGGGKINGMGQKWWDRSCKTNTSNPCRPAPTAITFHKCKNLKVRKLVILNSQKMHVTFSSCMRVAASKLVVLAPASSPNTDGIHISRTKSIEVKDSLIRTGDDCVSIVSNSSHVKIKNITCGPGHGISIGSLGKSGSWEKVQDVMVSDSYLHQTDNGVRIKTWQGGDGFASRITFNNIVMENVSNPIIIDQFYCDSPRACENQTSAVKVEDVSFIGIKGTSATEEAIKFACSDVLPCEKLYLEDVFLTLGFEGNIRSYCWQAHGSANGRVYPPHCFTETSNFLNAPNFWEELDSVILSLEQTHSVKKT